MLTSIENLGDFADMHNESAEADRLNKRRDRRAPDNVEETFKLKYCVCILMAVLKARWANFLPPYRIRLLGNF